jgi:hypothetical protein
MEHQLMNPISQLFALIVEQLPGCVAPGGRSWTVADESDREYAAVEYLFRDALNICDKKAGQRFAKLFGASATPVASATNSNAVRQPRTPRKVVEAPKYIQTRLTSLSAQAEMIRQLEKATPRRSPRISATKDT